MTNVEGTLAAAMEMTALELGLTMSIIITVLKKKTSSEAVIASLKAAIESLEASHD